MFTMRFTMRSTAAGPGARADSYGVLRRLRAGERVRVDGRWARVTPAPFTPGGPLLCYGGGTEVA